MLWAASPKRHSHPAIVDRDRTVRFPGAHLQLTGAFGNPKPIQRPHPPISPADARPRCCASPPSTPTCGTSPAATSTPPAAAHCWTATAPRSVAIPPPSPGRSTFRCPTAARRHLRCDRPSDRRRLRAHRPRAAVRPTRSASPSGSSTNSSPQRDRDSLEARTQPRLLTSHL